MASKSKEFVIDIKTAVDLEKQLEYSHFNTFVAVLDIYSSEWGVCKAINETFARLRNDFGDDKVRFFSVECHLVLDSLKHPSDDFNRHQQQRTKSLPADVLKDTAPETWQPILEERCGQSKPLFVFYKGGRKVTHIDGVNTPAVRALVKDLCAVKTPASDYITNGKLLELWDEYFVPEDSEVAFDRFLKVLSQLCGWTVPLIDEERLLLWEALGISKDAKEKIVTADALQKWIGDDENRTLPQAFKEKVPKYEERAARVQAEQEAEKKRIAEEEEKKKAEEAAAEEKRKKDEEEAQKQQKATKAAPPPAADQAPAEGDAKPAEPAADAAKPAETTEAKPAEAAQPADAPAEAKPADAKPAEAAKPADAPAEAKPAEAAPAEAKPAEAKPAEAKPAEASPAEAKPAEAAPADARPATAPKGDAAAPAPAPAPAPAEPRPATAPKDAAAPATAPAAAPAEPAPEPAAEPAPAPAPANASPAEARPATAPNDGTQPAAAA